VKEVNIFLLKFPVGRLDGLSGAASLRLVIAA
jgi:hypothetical protein